MHSFHMRIEFGMLWRRMYCCKCGTKLKRRSTSKLVNKGELGYENMKYLHIYGGPTSQIQVRYVYLCPNCKQITTYDQQIIIAKKQKQAKTKILDEYK